MKELRTLIEISNIAGSGSAKKKAELLRLCQTEDMRWLLSTSSNPFLTTKISKLNILTFCSSDPLAWIKIKGKIEYLFSAKAAKSEDRAFLEEQIGLLDVSLEEKEMLVKVLTKNLNIGIGVSSINKVFGGSFIPDLELMTAQDDIEQFDIENEHAAEIKYDGIRLIAVENEDGIVFYTRNFNVIQSSFMPNIEKECADLIKRFKQQTGSRGTVFLDGELTDKDRKSASGKVNQMLKGKSKAALDSDLVFNIFDVEDFSIITQKECGTLPYKMRRVQLEQAFPAGHTYSHLLRAEMHICSSRDETNRLFCEVVARGGEGLILKNPLSVYECKRSKNWIKLKEVNDCDLKIIGHFPGKNRRHENGWIGGWICETADGMLQVEVGSGFTDEMLKEFSANPDSHIGKIAKVQYNTKIQDRLGNWSLFLPVFLEIRDDKSTADALSAVK